jgi:lysozyme
VENNQKKYIVIFFSLLLLWVLVDKVLLNKIRKRYPNFGVNLPAGYTTHGIDVSRYQKEIDWSMVKKMRDNNAKIEFAIVKCTEGISNKDKFYTDNKEGAQDEKILFGAYHYFRASQDGEQQAAFFIKNAKLESGNLAPVLDVEETQGVPKALFQKRVKACLQKLEDEYHMKPIIYCNVDFYTAQLGKDFDTYPLWAAHYFVKKPDIYRNWILWQHSDKGHVDGIDADVDFNTVNGSILLLNKYCL